MAGAFLPVAAPNPTLEEDDMKEKLKHYRISEAEYERIGQLLGRAPAGVEWALFSALWSEHCSYKSSKVHLKKFASTLTPSVASAAGENAGIVDLGQGERVVFKMESHNHPSFIEPTQGAATGVGGILRDIFTMGARPIASADFLCFGETKADRMPQLVDGVVRGISGYGNAVGVPTVTGKTQFDPTYNRNILVNAMSVGLLLPEDPVALSAARGPGNDVVYVGAKTGKDGVHGAAMASESFAEDTEAKKPNVQIGDPFFEKLLIESCLEVIGKKLVVAIQDMGAAGLTSSSFEMAAKGGLGFELHLDRVPLRDLSMGPEEILLSESQERMLLVCEPAHFSELAEVFSRWGLDAVRIGKVRSAREMQIFWHGEKLAELDPALIVDQAPVYERPHGEWKSPRLRRADFSSARGARADAPPSTSAPTPSALEATALQPTALQPIMEQRLKSAAWGSRESIYRQYDQRVGGMTAAGCDHQIAVLRLPRSHRGLLLATGGRCSWLKRDVVVGALDAVLFPSLQMAVKGGYPVGATDCLNFGNPERPEIMTEFVASVEAIRDVCMALRIPVVSGNVSFYNETLGEGVTSTPAIGLLGLLPQVGCVGGEAATGENQPGDFFQREKSKLFLVELPWVEEENKLEWRLMSLAAAQTKSILSGIATQLAAIQHLVMTNQILSSQLIGEGGLAWGLAGFTKSGIGFRLERSTRDLVKDSLYQMVFEVDSRRQPDFSKLRALGLKVSEIGHTQANLIEAADWRMKVEEFWNQRRATMTELIH
ncbi:MAG: phosphoribosylformylglycinamidine synthase subunit PurL [Bdellovibrio sp.]|nr:MAG: phosphoribosylformylglycinamidine synthase subunit PurL [Bdellovibrio sp.]